MCHSRRWSGSVLYFWVVTLEIRAVATVFGRIANEFDRRMGARGLRRGSRRICKHRRGATGWGLYAAAVGHWMFKPPFC